MLGADKTVTITHFGYDSGTDTDIETTRTLRGCSWYGKNKVSAGATGLHPVRGYPCRIPEEAVSGSPLEIATGDKITCGDITATVLDWHDNRGRPSPHWYVEAS